MSRMSRKRLYPCFICEKRYAEIEDAEVCERSHAKPENPREKGDDDGIEYGHPGDRLRGLE